MVIYPTCMIVIEDVTYHREGGYPTDSAQKAGTPRRHRSKRHQQTSQRYDNLPDPSRRPSEEAQEDRRD